MRRWRVEIQGEHLVGRGDPPPVPSVECVYQQVERVTRIRERKSWAKARRIGRLTSGQPLHVRFARLHASPDEELRRFAQKHGLLGLDYWETLLRVQQAFVIVIRTLMWVRDGMAPSEVLWRRLEEEENLRHQAVIELVKEMEARQPVNGASARVSRERIADWRNQIDQVWALTSLAGAAERLRRKEIVSSEEVRPALVVLGGQTLADEWDHLDVTLNFERVERLLSLELTDRRPLRYGLRVTSEGIQAVAGTGSLLDAIYTSLVTSLVGNLPHRVCRECGRLFVPYRADQQYCPPETGKGPSRCGQRHRQRAHRLRSSGEDRDKGD